MHIILNIYVYALSAFVEIMKIGFDSFSVILNVLNINVLI